MSENKQAFDNYHPEIVPGLDRVVRAAKWVGNLFCMHQLASHGDHPFDHELYDSQTDALNNMNQVYFPDPVPDIEGKDL